MNYLVTFFLLYFRTLPQERWIRLLKGLDWVVSVGIKDQNKIKVTMQQATSKTRTSFQIWLYYRRLGHFSFNLIKSFFLHLFTEESIKSFKCDICQLLKHHHASYPTCDKKSYICLSSSWCLENYFRTYLFIKMIDYFYWWLYSLHDYRLWE